MSDSRTLTQRLSAVSRFWAKEEYDSALAEVEKLIKLWPGNGHLHILWASLVQLQEKPSHSLDEAKRSLQRAVDLEGSSAAGAIELGHFLDAVDDDPKAASKAFADGVAVARQQLIEGLIGQAKALNQLDKRNAALRCLLEAFSLMQFQSSAKRSKSERSGADLIFGLPSGAVFSVEFKGRFADEFEELLSDVVASRSA